MTSISGGAAIEVTKRIGQFDPAWDDLECSERYYAKVHTEFARRMFRARNGHTLLYAANRVLGGYDVLGGFNQKPRAWRFVVSKVRASALKGEGGASPAGFLPKDEVELIWRDHSNCLKNLRSTEVAEDVLFRKPGSLPSTVKYLFVLEVKEGASTEDARDWYRKKHLPALRDLVGDEVFGLRLAISNTVERQVATAPGTEPGQVMLPEYLDSTPRLAIEEFYFDNWSWGGEFFASEPVRRLYLKSPLDVQGYAVQEDVGVDHLSGAALSCRTEAVAR